jgi:hypothetical protein
MRRSSTRAALRPGARLAFGIDSSAHPENWIIKEDVMLIMAVHQVPSLTRERYEEVVRRLTNGKTRIESPSDLPFEGLLVHLAGQTKHGFCIVDLFESEEAVARFNEAMGTIPREVGIEEPPEFFPAHTFMSG